MKQTPTTIVDLSRLTLSYGEGKRIDLPVRIEPLELGGQAYATTSETLDTRLDISRPSGGYAFRLRFPLSIEGPCMRCLEPASLDPPPWSSTRRHRFQVDDIAGSLVRTQE